MSAEVVSARAARVLLLDESSERLRWIDTLLRPLVGASVPCQRLSEVPSSGFELAIIGYQSLSQETREALLASERLERLVLLLDSLETSREVVALLERRPSTSVIWTPNRLSGHDLFVIIDKLLEGHILGLEHHFPFGTPLKRFASLRVAREQPLMVDHARAFVSQFSLKGRLDRRFCWAFDQLLARLLSISTRDTDRSGGAPRVMLEAPLEIMLAGDDHRLGFAVRSAAVQTLSPRDAFLELTRPVNRPDFPALRGLSSGGLDSIAGELSHLSISTLTGQSTEAVGLLDARATEALSHRFVGIFAR